MKELFIIYRTELVKLKKSSAFWLIAAGAIFIPLFFVLNVMYSWKEYLISFTENSANPWQEYSRKLFNGEHFIFLSLIIVLTIALVFNIEYKSGGWKHIFVLPVSKSRLFIGKYLVVLTLVLGFYLVVILFYLMGGLFLSLWNPAFQFSEYTPSYKYGGVEINIALYLLKSFVSVLSVTAIHFWLSFRIKNFFIVIVIGVGGVVLATSMYIGHWQSIRYMPYGFPVLMCNYAHDHRFLTEFQLNSLGYFVVIAAFSYFDFTRFFKGG